MLEKLRYPRRNADGVDTGLLNHQFSDDRLNDILPAKTIEALGEQERRDILEKLVDLHREVVNDDEFAQRVRQAFLLVLRGQPELLEEAEYTRFLSKYGEPEDVTGIDWTNPREILALVDVLQKARFQTELGVERVTQYVHTLVRHALQYFERQGDVESMFYLFRRNPTPPDYMDDELYRMRSRLYLYEMRRVERLQRWLYIYLLLQAIFIVLIFPVVFVNVENHAITNVVEQTAEEVTGEAVNVPEEGGQRLSYTDGLYFTIVTAASIGYGDITPKTPIGKFIAAVLGVMGLISISVLAGLILSYLTPRQLI